jgi:hypothetical protein
MFQSTPKQREASRANAQKSTGPRTTAGKAASRFNALKHGIYAVHQIMFDETPEDLAELTDEYHELYSPADAKQRLLVDTLVNNEWRLRRMRRVEAELWQTAYDAFIVENIDRTSTCTSGDAFATGSATFERLQRVVNCCERVYHRASKELERLQEVARSHGLRTPQQESEPPASPEAGPEAKPEPAPTQQPEQSKPTSESSASFRHNSETPASPDRKPAPKHAPKPAPAPPFGPDAPAKPAETRRSTTDRDPKPPEAA